MREIIEASVTRHAQRFEVCRMIVVFAMIAMSNRQIKPTPARSTGESIAQHDSQAKISPKVRIPDNRLVSRRTEQIDRPSLENDGLRTFRGHGRASDWIALKTYLARRSVVNPCPCA